MVYCIFCFYTLLIFFPNFYTFWILKSEFKCHSSIEFIDVYYYGKVCREVATLSRLQHQHVVRYYQVTDPIILWFSFLAVIFCDSLKEFHNPYWNCLPAFFGFYLYDVQFQALLSVMFISCNCKSLQFLFLYLVCVV